MGGWHQRAVWEQQGVHWPNNWSDLPGDEGGEAWGVWAREAGKGG